MSLKMKRGIIVANATGFTPCQASGNLRTNYAPLDEKEEEGCVLTAVRVKRWKYFLK